MDLKIVFFRIRFLGILALFFSCNGQTKSKALQTKQPNEPATSLPEKNLLVFQDSKNTFWFGGNAKGVYAYDGKQLKLYTEKDGLIAPYVSHIKEDVQGNLYFNTIEGVSKFDGHQFTTLEISEGDAAENEWKLEPSDLWFNIGVESKGPYRYDGNYLYPLEFPKTKLVDEFHTKYPNASYNPYDIYKMYRDSKGDMWFGTSSVGIFRYDGKSVDWLYEEQLQKTPSGGDFGIRSILEDKNGYYWFNNTRYRYNIITNTSKNTTSGTIKYEKKKGLDEDNVPYFLSIAEDNDGALWMVTYDNGVWKSNGQQLIHYPIKDEEKEVLLFSIYKDNQGILWLGTHNAGVYRFNGVSFEKFRP